MIFRCLATQDREIVLPKKRRHHEFGVVVGSCHASALIFQSKLFLILAVRNDDLHLMMHLFLLKAAVCRMLMLRVRKAHCLTEHSPYTHNGLNLSVWNGHIHICFSSKVLSVSCSVSVYSRRAPLAPVATTWHTSTSAPSFWSSSSQICCFWDSRSLGPFTSTTYNKMSYVTLHVAV